MDGTALPYISGWYIGRRCFNSRETELRRRCVEQQAEWRWSSAKELGECGGGVLVDASPDFVTPSFSLLSILSQGGCYPFLLSQWSEYGGMRPQWRLHNPAKVQEPYPLSYRLVHELERAAATAWSPQMAKAFIVHGLLEHFSRHSLNPTQAPFRATSSSLLCRLTLAPHG